MGRAGSRRRHARATVLTAALLLGAACSSRAKTDTFVQRFPPRSAGFDLLFMIDNSLGVDAVVRKFVMAFPVLSQVLAALPGGMPDLHIAVVSSDMGAGRFDEALVPQCRHGGDQGVFQDAPRATCTASGLAAGQHFISIVGGVPNYDATKTLPEVFDCIAQLGGQGCGFEHPLASIARALGADGAPAPRENAGFLRPDATLAIVLVTDEDDCSAPPDSDLFDPSSRLVADRYGPLTSYRCNEFGHLCNGKHPPRAMAASFGDGCRSAEDGVLLRVADLAAGVKALKDDPGKLLVFAIAGPPSPYDVELDVPTLKEDPSMWPSVAHSCTDSDGTYADPAVRINQWVGLFGGQGSFYAACAPSFAPALQLIAGRLAATAMGCLRALPPGLDPAAPDVARCRAVVETPTAGAPMQTALPGCPGGGGVACFSLQPNPACPVSGLALAVDASGGPAPPDTATVVVTCEPP